MRGGSKEAIMNICDKGHERIIHDAKICPLCDAQREIDEYQRELETYRGLEKDVAAWIKSKLDESTINAGGIPEKTVTFNGVQPN
jgi:hypothetical protein